MTAQPEAAINLLMACKQDGFHTAIETCGYVKKDVLMRFAEFVELFLFDLKHIDPDRHFPVSYTHLPLGGMFLDLKRRYLTTKYCGARRRDFERMFEISPLFLAGKLGKRRVKQITNW